MASVVRVKNEVVEERISFDLSPNGHLLEVPRYPPVKYNAAGARARGLELVDALAAKLNTMPLGSNLRKEEFNGTIAKLRALAEVHKTLIAFCGPTGAGKSMLINALLGLGVNVAPTSSMQACTAVVTEIAYKPTAGFEADIEFLTLAEWSDELRVLLGDIQDPNNHESTDEVAAASAKITVLYPKIKKEELKTMTVKQLLAFDSSLSLYLGNTASIVQDDPDRFTQELSRYLDSDLPVEEGPGLGKASHSGAVWPLIRHVRIRVNSALLASGAVLVDLPGTGDSNAARNQVAQAFMKKADKFFILAPITRAVSDRVAMELCGQAFKTQIMMDGKYHSHAITFIATKCDEVHEKEIIRELKLSNHPELQNIEKSIKDAKTNLDQWKAAVERLKAQKDTLDEKIKLWKDCTSALPQSAHTERDIGHNGATSKRTHPYESEEHYDGNHKRPRIDTAPTLSSTTADINMEVQTASADLMSTLRQLDSTTSLIAACEKKLANAKQRKTAFCAQKRSEWSSSALKAQFRSGMEEMEVDDVVQDQEPDNNTSHDMYDLTVFTVSAWAYMKAQDIEDGPAPALDSAATGIPALQSWINTITLPTEHKIAEQLLLQTRDFISVIEVWLDGAPGVSSSDREKLKAQWRSKRSSDGKLSNPQKTPSRQLWSEWYRSSPRTAVIPTLLREFQPIVDHLMEGISKRFATTLGQKLQTSAVEATKDIVDTAKVITSSIHHATFRATLRRHGVYKKDLNALLAVPFTKQIAQTWSKVFATHLLKSLEKQVMAQITQVLNNVVDSVPPYLHPRAKAATSTIKWNAQRALKAVQASVTQAMDAFKLELGASLSPLLQAHLVAGYNIAVLETGKGSDRRRKEIFCKHVEAKKEVLYVGTADALRARLEDASKVVGDALDKALEEIARKVEVDISVLWECCPLEGEEDVKERVSMKELLRDTAADVDRWLKAKKEHDDKAAAAGAPVSQ
ncbi:hypothetical protein C2E23DRAFT_95041 [Lenzites betulinus]|nr:hypothetical protein C2E23DRAFT_95041 [Lenzites betulinus]